VHIAKLYLKFIILIEQFLENNFKIRMTQIEQLTEDKSEEITEWAINYFQKNKEILQFYNINSPEQLIERLSKPKIAESEIY
jgi:hypothetical protein